MGTKPQLQCAKYCRMCGQHTLHITTTDESVTLAWGLLCMLTCFLALPFYLLYVLFKKDWMCSNCSTRRK